MKLNSFITALILLLSLSACSSNKLTQKSAQQTSSHPISVINLKASQSIDDIAGKLAKHRTVFVGESHTNYSDHLNQLAVIKSLHKRWGKQTSIGLEMIQKPYQSFLDDYIAGKITEKEMLRGTQWYQRWKYDFRLYRPIFDYAKTNMIPLVALNVPQELTKKITKVGINGLNKKERQNLPPFIDRSNKKYVKRITSVFSRHSHTSSKGIQKFLDAQLAWDEGMAFSAANFLKKNPKKKMVIIAGSGHVINYEGIPDRLDRQLHSKSAVVLNDIQGDSLAVNGDYLLFSPVKKLSRVGRIGIAMDETAQHNGVKVSMISPKGAAKQAGIQKGDVIIKLDNQKISDILDLKVFIQDKPPGSKITAQLRRKNQQLTRKMTLKSPPISPFMMK